MLSQWHALAADLRRRRPRTAAEAFYTAMEPAVWATVLYRTARQLYLCPVPVLRPLLRLAGFLLFKVSEVVLGVAIPPGVPIGPGLYIGHIGQIRFHHEARAGANLSIGPGVLVGTRGLGRRGAPTLGDEVFVGAGAKILGPVRVGHRARIGANAVVLADVPDGATAVGVPAVIRKPSGEPRPGAESTP